MLDKTNLVMLLFGLLVLGVSAIGVVLIRMKRAKAVARSRISGEVGGQTRPKNAQEQQTLDTLLFAVELGRASLEPEDRPDRQWSGQVAGRDWIVCRACGAEVRHGCASIANGTWSPVQVRLRRTRRRRRTTFRGGLPKSPPRSDSSLTQPRVPRVGSSQPEPNGVQGGGLEQGGTERTPEEPRQVRLPRLTELRGTLFSTGIKELDHARHENEHAAETKQTANEMAPLEAFLGAAELQRNATPPQTADAEPMEADSSGAARTG